MKVKALNGLLHLRHVESTKMNLSKSVNLSQVMRFDAMDFHLNKVITNPNE